MCLNLIVPMIRRSNRQTNYARTKEKARKDAWRPLGTSLRVLVGALARKG